MGTDKSAKKVSKSKRGQQEHDERPPAAATTATETEQPKQDGSKMEIEEPAHGEGQVAATSAKDGLAESQPQREGGEGEENGAEAEAEIDPKVRIASASDDLTSVTFAIADEDHTLGNALRWAIMKNSQVDFCGYSIPHPADNIMNVRIQTTDDTNAIKAMEKGLDDLESMAKFIHGKLHEELSAGNYNTSGEVHILD
ncbi:RNA polymerase subunit AC19 [Spiromyces aspiralis]|uniref:RNA polymerase subunit AC19 n=1 Tax=Spiromyces aspiralis TaxID=68401 RepID=A0ACC1HNF0_9FUNG|nr:RNA polymerase subunit AC19 [Spiromyces aspiralis]